MKSAIAVFVAALAFCAGAVRAETFDLATVAMNQASLAEEMPVLAQAAIKAYREANREKYLDTLFRMQMVAGRWTEAQQTLAALDALRGGATPETRARNVQYEIFISAKLAGAKNGSSFDQAFARAFRERIGALDDATAAMVSRAFFAQAYSAGISLHVPLDETFRDDFDRLKGKTSLGLDEAVRLIEDYQAASNYDAFAPLITDLVRADDQRRYLVEVTPVRTFDGATVCAMIVRPRGEKVRLPTLLEFTIYADDVVNFSEARRSASHGYVGVAGLTRGKGCSSDATVPYEHDGADAAALIDWIAKQPWSDGRVGMFGGSYDGFTQWAAAKHHPKALKALMPSVTTAPGRNTPAEGGVIQSFDYYWPFYTTDNKTLDDTALNDGPRWKRMFHEWYLTGAPYRSMDMIDGRLNPIWDRLLQHPLYDAYYQAMIPFREEFAGIHIPVLTTTGYYDGAQIGALYYLSQQYRYDPKANHYLVIGPYSHHTGNRGTVDVLGEEADQLDEYELDRVAHIDIGQLRYQWFDYIFKSGPKPAILNDRINYEVMGANAWRHAPSLNALSAHTMRFHLSAIRADSGAYRLSLRPSSKPPAVLKVDLADRTDVDRRPVGGGVVDDAINTANGLEFVSDPLPRSVEAAGLFSGCLNLRINKKDFDFEIDLYELTPKGHYLALTYYLARASQVGDLTRRRLLVPGTRQRLEFTAGRMIGRKMEAGSRLIAVLSVGKSPYGQINYGTGKDVSDETRADAGSPLVVEWFGNSFLDIPIRGNRGESKPLAIRN